MPTNKTPPDGDIDDLVGDAIDDKRDLLEKRNVKILQQLLANEWGALSAKEVAYRNPDVGESTIRDHLRALNERNPSFVEKLTVESEHRKQGLPYKYFAASEYAIELMKEVGVYDGISVLFQMYDRMERSESITAIEAFEHRPAPDWL